jgi:Na+/H+-dicarboxylate symporter
MLKFRLLTTSQVPITEMYAVVVAIDWFIDRFRTACNVSGDLYALAVVCKITGVKDPEDTEIVEHNLSHETSCV